MKIKKIINNLLFAIAVFQIGCLSYLQYEPQNDDPKSLLGKEYLVSLDSTWTTKQAEKLFKIFKSISPDQTAQASLWKISNDDLENDIKIDSQAGQQSVSQAGQQSVSQAGQQSVTISRNVFVVDESQQASISDKRLFNTVVQFITENGTNRPKIKRILEKRYGISVDVTSDVVQHVLSPAYAAHKRYPKGFPEIDNEDLMLFISILEDFPQALHKIPQLKYIVCRDEDLGDGAAARAWTTSGFIEFNKSVLDNAPISEIRKLLAHEKSHFLWRHLLPIQLKEDWIALGGWYENKESQHGWSTNRKREEFVTDYAFQKNPNEDMADSLAYYLVDPDKLRACNMAKYNFIHERIMLTYGKRYISPDMLSGM